MQCQPRHGFFVVELDRGRLCGDTNFDDIDHVCGVLETPAAVKKLFKLRAACSGTFRDEEAWWIQTYGYYWKPQEEE